MNELETKLLKQVSTAASSFSSTTFSSSTATAPNNEVVPSCVVLYHEGVSAHRVLEGHTEQNGRVVKCFQGNRPVMLLRRVLPVCLPCTHCAIWCSLWGFFWCMFLQALMASRQKYQEVLDQITNRSLKHIMIQNSFDFQTYSRKDDPKGTHCSLPLLSTPPVVVPH